MGEGRRGSREGVSLLTPGAPRVGVHPHACLSLWARGPSQPVPAAVLPARSARFGSCRCGVRPPLLRARIGLISERRTRAASSEAAADPQTDNEHTARRAAVSANTARAGPVSGRVDQAETFLQKEENR